MDKKLFWTLAKGRVTANNLALYRHFFKNETLASIAHDTGIGITVLHNARRRLLAYKKRVEDVLNDKKING